jgi:hypothetical protein
MVKWKPVYKNDVWSFRFAGFGVKKLQAVDEDFHIGDFIMYGSIAGDRCGLRASDSK